MIKIRKGTQILSVSKSAFEEFYRGAGWIQMIDKVESSPWENKVRAASTSELKKMAQEKGIDTTGASKRTLIEALLKK